MAILLLLLVFAAVVVDPYSAFRTPRIAGVNEYKPMGLPFMRLVKPYHINLLDQDVLVTGSSRAGRGIDCRYFQDSGGSCYNAGLTGGGIYEAYRFLQQKSQTREQVVLFLDFFAFMRLEKANAAFVEERLLRNVNGNFNSAFPGRAIDDLFGLLFSRQTLESSRKTFKWQGRSSVNPRADGMLYLDDWGGWHFDAATLEPVEPNQRVNRQVLRYEHILHTMNNFYEVHAQDRGVTGQNIHRQLGWYTKVLELLYARELKASLVLPPSHVSYWMLLHLQGFNPQFEQWKRDLVRINEEIARANTAQVLPLFDFSGPNLVAMSKPPRKNDPATFNTVFTDVMHFSRRVGQRILDRVSAGCDSANDALFGNCLRSDNIDSHLRRQASLYRERESQTRQYLETMFSDLGRNRSRQ